MCSEDAQIRNFFNGLAPPKIDEQLEALVKKEAFKEQRLSLIKKYIWKALCKYTHTGGIHVHRWNTSDGIEIIYFPAEVLEVIRFADLVSTLSVLGVLSLANDGKTSEDLLMRFKARIKARVLTTACRRRERSRTFTAHGPYQLSPQGIAKWQQH